MKETKFNLSEKELAKIKMDNKTETYDDVLICPWCHEKNEDCFELDDDGEEVDCDSCGKKIVYSIYRSVSYTGHLPDEELNRLLKINKEKEQEQSHSFRCGTCNLIEENISANEVIDLSKLHFSGKHIDIDDLRKLKNEKI